jgi:regulator of protease activity HflC (stomatin/prohibitin superfamily)
MSQERIVRGQSGWFLVLVNFLLFAAAPALFARGVFVLDRSRGASLSGFLMVVLAVLDLILAILTTKGFIILQPNESGVLTLVGRYGGSLKTNGFWWVNPFNTKRKVSLRFHNLNGDKLKVNDKAGNPIEIAAVVVWRVEDTFAACFQVENYADYVNTQSESALRHLASSYPYDSWEEGDEHAVSLRGNIDVVSEALEKELQERLNKAGVKVVEARLSHLAYAPEIAGAMLQRQQASAIISARQKIVEGAVGMVQMALARLSAEKVLELDEEKKATMVSNLLVVLCGEREVHPVINAGSLY